MDEAPIDALVKLMRMEYLEMPDLKLTFLQARRLWDAPADLCLGALNVLVDAGFLVQSRDGRFLRRGSFLQKSA
jgi:hypothetical protein